MQYLYVVFNKKSAYALLSGSDANLRNLGGHTLVMWEAVRYFMIKLNTLTSEVLILNGLKPTSKDSEVPSLLIFISTMTN